MKPKKTETTESQTLPLAQQPTADVVLAGLNFSRVSPTNVLMVQQPTADVLAGLAAQARFAMLDSMAAAQAALALWRDAATTLAGAQRQADLCHATYVTPLAGLRQPEKWPATFDEFLKFVVRGKDAGEQLARFRQFLRMKVTADPGSYGLMKGKLTEAKVLDATQKLLADFQAGRYSREAWQSLALEFHRFWKRYKAELKSQAGKQGVAARAAKRVAEK